jgi:protein arginine kinase activator
MAEEHSRPKGELCECCGLRPAEMLVTDVDRGGGKQVQRLCGQCAEERGLMSASALKLTEVLQELRDRVAEDDSRVACPRCGCTFADFRKSLRLGCEDCYATFAGELAPMIRRMHGASRHAGRLPRGNGNAARNFEVQRLGRELRAAIAAEDYERAAAVRDRIRELGEEAPEAGGG